MNKRVARWWREYNRAQKYPDLQAAYVKDPENLEFEEYFNEWFHAFLREKQKGT